LVMFSNLTITAEVGILMVIADSHRARSSERANHGQSLRVYADEDIYFT
jgi:hypothetical protein